MNDRHDKLMRQVAAYCDGRLDTASLAAFEARLSEDTQAVDVLIDYMDLHAQLRWVESALHAQVDHPPASQAPATTARPTNRWRLGVSMFALAAAVLIAATAWFLFLPEPRTPNPEPSPTPPPSVATLTDSRGATFADTPGPMNLGASLPPGPIKLTSGTAQLMFASTATVDLQGPCEFEMTGPNRGRLTSGSLKASVPEAAKGFTIDLPDGSRLVDLGTAFGVRVNAAGDATVHVTEGRVAWSTPGPNATSVFIDAGRIARLVDGRVNVTDAPAFIAYHDFGGQPSPGHITTQQSLDQTIRLIDQATGQDTGIELSITGAVGIDTRTTGVTRPPAPATPADELFGGTGLDLDDGLINVGGNNPSKSMTITLVGLDPDEQYDLALYGDRNAPADGPERFTLNGADSATNAASVGVIDGFTTELETRPNAELGHVVRWTDIATSADGILEIKIEAATSKPLNIAYISALRIAGTPRSIPRQQEIRDDSHDNQTRRPSTQYSHKENHHE